MSYPRKISKQSTRHPAINVVTHKMQINLSGQSNKYENKLAFNLNNYLYKTTENSM